MYSFKFLSQSGTLVEVLFDDGEWYPGEIMRLNAATGDHRIAFDDGDFQDIRLPDPDVRFPKSHTRNAHPLKMMEFVIFFDFN
jgi:hypothetical protein